MSSLISIIIPCCKNRKYLLRCINSIKRQTYTNTEILLVSNQSVDAKEYDVKVVSVIQDAVSQAKGKYVFFCSNTSVLTNNVLEELYVNMQNTGVDLSCVSIYVPDLNDAVQYMESSETMSVYGKLYKKDILEKCVANNEDGVFVLQSLLAKYLVSCNGIYESKNAIVYENDVDSEEYKNLQKFEMMAWKRVFELVGTDFNQKNAMGKKIDGVVRELEKSKDIEHKVSYITSDDNQTLLILSEASWIKDEIKSDNKKAQISVQVDGNMSVSSFLEQMNGDILVAFVVDKYAEGKLGLKSLIRSLIAWIKYKF